MQHGICNGRLWWLLTGAFTRLPLHACPPTDEFIYSYTATSGFLLEAYTKEAPRNTYRFGVVGVTHTGPEKLHFLKGVGEEVKKITAIIKQPDVECLEGKPAAVDAVKALLQDCSSLPFQQHLARHHDLEVANVEVPDVGEYLRIEFFLFQALRSPL
ncbi:hypothetical protein B0H13DRAFT_1863419 [Mycena leptocephala]|nr:hypothetical protein B0H13DRAFT_1863419 [Mycena leptocephala]